MEPGFVLNQYVFIEPLGEGGMAEVWKARHSRLDYDVAIKFLKPQFAHDFDLQERFLNEGRRQATLDHPNIVRAIDFISENNRSFLVMKYVEGCGLDHRLEQAHGPLPLEEALNVSFQVLSALGYAHQQNVVHRDVKSSNILIDGKGRCYLTDFGIALAIGKKRLTRTGTVMGTDYYMSPEQIRNSHTLDHRTDIYAFGVVLFEMLTGRLPFDYDNEFLLKQAHVQEPPPEPSTLNPAIGRALERVVLRALAKKPDDRWNSCETMAEALERAHPGTPGGVRKTQPADPVEPNQRKETDAGSESGRRSRRRWPVIAAVVALATVGVLTAARIRGYLRLGNHPIPVSISSFSADPKVMKAGTHAMLRWDVKNAETVSIDHGIGEVGQSGDREIRPTVTTRYILSASGRGVNRSAEVIVEVDREASPPFKEEKKGPKPGPETIGPENNQPDTKTEPPVISNFRAEPDSLTAGDSAKLSWVVRGARSIRIEPLLGEIVPPATGFVTVTPPATTEYTLRARNGTAEQQMKLTIQVRPKALPVDPSISLENGETMLRTHEYAKAREFLLAGAKGGSSEAMVLLATLYSRGLGGEANPEEAVRWFEQAAHNGNIRGMYNLGLMYENGWEGHKKNVATAANVYADAVHAGSKDAALRLGMLYETGSGVPRDINEARELYQTAGTPEALSRLKMLGPKRALGENTETTRHTVLTVNGISDSIQLNSTKQYRLSGSGFSPASEISLDVPGTVGSRSGTDNHRPVEVEPDGHWLNVYISITPTATPNALRIIVRNPDGAQATFLARVKQ